MSEIVASLDTLAASANRAHREAERLALSTLDYARQAGEALNEAKVQMAHGGWGPWLAANFEGSERTAQVYMRVANRWDEIESAKAHGRADLSLTEARGLLESPRTADSSLGESLASYDALFAAEEAHMDAANAELQTAVEDFDWEKPPSPEDLPDVVRIVDLAEALQKSAVLVQVYALRAMAVAVDAGVAAGTIRI